MADDDDGKDAVMSNAPSNNPNLRSINRTPPTPPADVLADLERQQGLEDAKRAAEIRTTPASYVHCRTFGHLWFDINADRNPSIGWYMKLQCERCGMIRSDIVNRYGEVERRHYTPPEGYRDPDGWKKTTWRMEFLRKLSE